MEGCRVSLEVRLLHHTSDGRAVPIYTSRDRGTVLRVGKVLRDVEREREQNCAALGDSVEQRIAQSEADRIILALHAAGLHHAVSRST